MGIYRTLLEEEVPHLDDNNNPDDQIKELQDVIDDHDANEAEQQAAQDAAFGPDCGVDDIMDESAIAIYEFEAGHAAIMQALGMHELQEAATGREFIMEGADIKGFFKSIKDKIVSFFKKVWSVLQRWAGNIGAVCVTNKKFADKYASKMSDGYSIVTSSSYKGKKLKGYEFSGVDGAIAVARSGKSSEKTFGTDKVMPAIRQAIEDKKEVSGLVGGLSTEEVEAAGNKFRGSLCNEDSVSTSDFSEKLKTHLYGSKEPKEMWMKVGDVTSILNNKKDARKDVTEFMKESKKQYSKVIKDFNDLERSASKMESGVTRNSIMSLITRYTTVIRTELTATQTWRNATLGAINARARQARRYGMAYVAAANKGKHKGFQKESTEYGFLGSLGLV